jgi:site-specific recombinase XerD
MQSRKRPIEILTRAEVWALIKVCSSRYPTGIRNRALIAVLYRAGLRLAEALDLRPKDLDREQGTIRVLHGKGDKARTVGMDPEAFALVERWLDARAARGINGRATVFCTLRGGHLKHSYVQALFPRLARKAGVEKRVHAHGFRHTMAVEMRREGVDIEIIRRQLGHTSLEMTARYLQHLAPEEVVEAMTARSWDA